MVLSNAMILDSDFSLRRLDLQLKGDRITGIGKCVDDELVVDFRNCYIIPGFIDTHIHGANGVRISDSLADLEKITEFEATQGVTSLAITTAASDFDDILRQFRIVVNSASKCKGAKIAGIHAEGPFLSTKYKGAMNPEFILPPDQLKLDQMIEAAEGYLKMITIAPEAERAEEFIRYAVACGLTVSLGHSDAKYEEAKRAISAGATQATHTFNAMRPYNHREPGIIGAVLASDMVVCEVICDYVHLHPETVKMIWKLKGADKINIVSDSGHAAGMQLEEFVVDGIVRYVKDGVVRLADGTIAGSAKTLLDGVRNLIQSGIPLSEVSRMASLNPARSLKLDRETGSISIGKCADLVVLDSAYNVICTIINGNIVYRNF